MDRTKLTIFSILALCVAAQMNIDAGYGKHKQQQTSTTEATTQGSQDKGNRRQNRRQNRRKKREQRRNRNEEPRGPVRRTVRGAGNVASDVTESAGDIVAAPFRAF